MNRSAELPLGAAQASDRAEQELGAPTEFMALMRNLGIEEALHEPALARSPAFRRQDVRPAKAGTPCQQPPFMAPMRDARIVEASHESMIGGPGFAWPP